MKIFGDDGFRDKYDHGLMSRDFLLNFFYSLNIFLYEKKISTIYIAYDTRFSAKPILQIILKKLKNLRNIFIIDRPVTTPYLHHLSKKTNSFSIMITASHFKWNYNGFKFFYKGEKISKKFEDDILSYLKKINQLNIKKINQLNIKKINIKRIYSKMYVEYLNKKFVNIPKKRIIFDLANGGACSFKNQLKIFKKYKIINHTFNGKNINKNSGSNYIKKTLSKKISFDYLISFDGDGDRVIIAKKKYGVIETEKLALVFALYLFKKNKKKYNIVGTEITNPWFLNKLRKIGIKFTRSKVGDRNVINKQTQNKSIFGFETSGHFSFKKSMDGIFTAILFLQILKKKPNLINEILNQKIDYNQIILKVSPNRYNYISKHLKKLKEVSVIKRKSIWENIYKFHIFYKKNSIKTVRKFFESNYQKAIKSKFHSQLEV